MDFGAEGRTAMQITITKVERIEATDRHMNEIEGHM